MHNKQNLYANYCLQVLLEIRRLLVESEAAHPSRGAVASITFSAASPSKIGKDTPRLLKRPSNLKRSVR